MTATALGPLDSTRLWDNPDAVRLYRAFCRKHPRYRQANAELIRHAALEPGLTVLDLGAGLGGTAAAALGAMGGQGRGRVIAVEPAGAMRRAGARMADRGITWHSEIPDGCRPDRILCGAGIWQLTPLAQALSLLRDQLSPGTALCFNIPAVYLGEPDPPGGGRDPHLLELPARLTRGEPPAEAPEGWEPLPDAAGMERLLGDAGFRAAGWEFSLRLTQAACRDWLKLPACSAPLFPGLTSKERAARIDAAFAQCDPRSWRWERWRGWTAWAE
jgi:SAM-dependent methyltransferase